MEEDHLTKFDLEHLVETDDFTIFNQDDLAVGGFQVMEDIRRKGKLCDVTLKVGQGDKKGKLRPSLLYLLLNYKFSYTSLL